MKKILLGAILALTLIVGQTGSAFAQDTTSINGTVQSITLETDANTGTTTVLVTYTFTDSTGVEQTATVRLSVETAAGLGLVTTDTTSNTTSVNNASIGSTVTIDPATVIADTNPTEDEHPVGSALSDFFTDMLGVDYDTIMEYHGDGMGFGVIAQGLWLTYQLGGDTSTFSALMDAKQSGDYSNITLADGSTPDNWGDVVKSLKQGENLGSVKSGRADSENSKGNSNKEEKGKDNAGSENSKGNENSGKSNGNTDSQGNGNSGKNGIDNPTDPGKGNGGNGNSTDPSQGNGNSGSNNGNGNKGNGGGGGGDKGGGGGGGKP